MSINVGYFVRESIQNFQRNWVMSLGAVVTISLSLLVVGIFLITGVVVNKIVEGVESKVSIQVFIKDGAASADVNALQEQLLADELVAGVDYTTKEEAMAKFEKQWEQSPELFEGLDGSNPFPASLDVTLKEPKTVEQMASNIKANELFPKVADRPDNLDRSLKWGEDIVDRLFAVTRVIRIVEVVFVAMLAVVSLIFINNTIRLAIYARRKEIGIMRLVGASNWFIRTPFLLEGVIQALIGSAIAISALMGLQALVMPKVRELVPFMVVTLSRGSLVQISVALVVSGILIGILGSGLAMRRYLRV